jgi:cytochrome P450
MVDEEVFITPAKCTFFPWSDGPQNCPGAKFSQVEFVAVIARLLRGHRYTAVQRRGESWEDTRKRVLETTCEIDMEMLPKMKDADRVRLVCKRVTVDSRST